VARSALDRLHEVGWRRATRLTGSWALPLPPRPRCARDLFLSRGPHTARLLLHRLLGELLERDMDVGQELPGRRRAGCARWPSLCPVERLMVRR
jgi:hypothetical protein